MSEELTYDPSVDITAGEIRAMGWPVPEDIPDCAHTPRSSLRWKSGGAKMDESDPGKIVFSLGLEFTMPFQWISITATIDDNATIDEVVE